VYSISFDITRKTLKKENNKRDELKNNFDFIIQSAKLNIEDEKRRSSGGIPRILTVRTENN